VEHSPWGIRILLKQRCYRSDAKTASKDGPSKNLERTIPKEKRVDNLFSRQCTKLEGEYCLRSKMNLFVKGADEGKNERLGREKKGMT